MSYQKTHVLPLLALVSLSVTIGGVTAQQASVNVHQSQNSRSFHSDAASLAESVGPDGSKRGECAYYDSDVGQQIKIRFVHPYGGTAGYVITEGNTRIEPAVAYQQCVERARTNQRHNVAAFQQQFAGGFASPFIAPHLPNVNTQYTGAFPEDNINAQSQSVHSSFGNEEPSNYMQQITANIENQRRAMNSFNEQMQHNMARIQQQNLNLHNHLAQQFGR